MFFEKTHTYRLVVMFNFVNDIEIGDHGEYITKFTTDRPEAIPFVVEQMDLKTILLRYNKIYEPSRFNNYEKRDFGILTKRNTNGKTGWCFMGITYKYAHESMIFY
jgi:hypothetical protein